MKKVVIRSKQSAELIDTPEPKAKGHWAVVKIHVAPLCTEYKAFDSGENPDCLGHEAAGEVIEVAQAGPVKVGDRVVVMPQYPCGECSLCIEGEYIHCEDVVDIHQFTGASAGQDTYAQCLIKHDWLLPVIPEDISYEHASMLCCGLGPTFGAMQRMNVSAFDTVLISGMGPVGLGGIVNAVHRNAKVIAVVSNPYRAELAKSLGAYAIVNPNDADALLKIKNLTGGKGADKSIDCAGHPDAQKLCIHGTRRNGEVSFVGESDDLTVKVSDDLIRNGLKLHGIWHYNLNDIPLLFQVVREQGHLLDKMITHTFGMSQVEDAWKLQLTRQCGKVLLYPWK